MSSSRSAAARRSAAAGVRTVPRALPTPLVARGRLTALPAVSFAGAGDRLAALRAAVLVAERFAAPAADLALARDGEVAVRRAPDFVAPVPERFVLQDRAAEDGVVVAMATCRAG